MVGSHQVLNAFTTLIVTLDPPGLAPIFLGLTSGMDRAERRLTSVRGTIIAFCILAAFALTGQSILDFLGISMGAFRISGGLLLFYIAFEMIFERRQERKEKSTEVAISKDHIHHLAVFPLALPLISGPGSISATILLTGSFASAIDRIILLAVIAACMGLVFLALMVSSQIDRYLGITGRAILTRLLGVLLAALSIQFIVDGIKSAMAG
jgi:multiple antibiotic resistance protein